MFGFKAEFQTTKGQDHNNDNEEAVYKSFRRQKEWRQFMNNRVAQARPMPSPF